MVKFSQNFNKDLRKKNTLGMKLNFLLLRHISNTTARVRCFRETRKSPQ